MKKILIISNHFAPENSIAAVRLTKIAKFLNLNNYEIDVLLTKSKFEIIDKTLESDLKYINKVFILENSLPLMKLRDFLVTQSYKKKSISNSKKHSKKLTFIKSHLSYAFRLILQYDLKYRAQFRYKKLFKNFDYSHLISSYGPHSSIFIGRYFKKKFPKIFWISDFRDSVYQNTVPLLFKKFAKNFIENYCLDSQIIISASKEQIKQFFLKDMKKKAYVLHNGFDRDDLESTVPIVKKENFYTISYTGTYYKNQQSLSVLFEALKDLNQLGDIDINKVRFNYVGKQYFEVKKIVDSYNLNQIFNYKGFVNRSEALKIQLNSNLLVFCSWHHYDEFKSLGGKFFEYLMIGKPILVIVAGDKKNSEVKLIMRDLNFGFVYEQASHNQDYKKLKIYLSNGYFRHFNGGFSHHLKNVSNEKIEKYSYMFQVDKFTKFMEKVFSDYNKNIDRNVEKKRAKL